jgi:predicted Zn-dependent peptidase
MLEHKLNSDATIDAVRNIVWEELDTLKTDLLGERELQKIKNKAESNLIFSETSTLNKAITLAYFESLDRIELINEEVEKYQSITVEDLKNAAEDIFDRDKMIELVYEPID